MLEIVSFGNIVNSLRSVRNDYHEHLKSIPQYEAFLLVESSTEKVAGTLQNIETGPAPSMAAEVIGALEIAKTKFRQHLTSVPEYRALLAIDRLINDVSTDLSVGATSNAPTTETGAPPAEPNVVVERTADVHPDTPRVQAPAAVQVSADALPQPEPIIQVTAQAETAPDLPAADTISQIQDALRHEPEPRQVAYSDAAPDLQDALTTQVSTEPQSTTAPPPESPEHGAERAA